MESCNVDQGKSLTELGRKARARLEAERSKRPEIVRISESDAVLPSPTTNKKRVFGRAAKTTTKQRQRRRIATPKSTDEVLDRDVDRWMPGINQLPKCISKANRSRLVQLHGLPYGATSTDIRRFFTGLSPQRILVIPSYHHGTVTELDADHNVPRKNGGLKRYPSSLRVFVQFESGPAATLAADRSGEVMPFRQDVDVRPPLDQLNSTDEPSLSGCALAVTQVLKPIASYLLKHMVIDVTPQLPLHNSLGWLEEKLDPKINDILWESSRHILNIKPASKAPSTITIFESGRNDPRNSKEDYDKLEQHRSHLFHVLQKLRYQLPFPSAEILDPALSVDPILRLSSGATACLEVEIERLDDELLRASRWRTGIREWLELAKEQSGIES